MDKSKKTPVIIIFISVVVALAICYGLFRFYKISTEKNKLLSLQHKFGSNFPGSDYRPPDRTNWMWGLNPDKLRINQIVWPGTHDSATNGIGIRYLTRPFAQCQTLSIYEQLKLGTRVLDIRVQEDRNVCHGILVSYNIDRVINDVKKFLEETHSEIIILEVRTEFGHDNPHEFDKYLIDQLGEYLILQNQSVFGKTISELLPKRVIFVWQPYDMNVTTHIGGPIWNSSALRDNWMDTDLPYTKFNNNFKYLAEQQTLENRTYFYRVENTLTAQLDDYLITDVIKTVDKRIKSYARTFISQCFAKGIGDKLQILSTDFIDEDFVDACVGLTRARVEGLKS